MGDKPKSKLDEMLDMYKTEASVPGKKRRETKQRKLHDTIDQTAIKFLIKKRGADADDSSVPSSYDIESHDEAHEMVIAIAKAVIKHKFPKIKVGDLDEHHLLELFDTATGQRGYAHNLIAEIAEQKHNVLDGEDYKNAKAAVAQHIAHYKFNHAGQYLISNKDARDKIDGIVEKEIGKHGKTMRKGLSQATVVQHLASVYGGNITEQYVDKDYAGHFKKAAKPAK